MHALVRGINGKGFQMAILTFYVAVDMSLTQFAIENTAFEETLITYSGEGFSESLTGVFDDTAGIDGIITTIQRMQQNLQIFLIEGLDLDASDYFVMREAGGESLYEFIFSGDDQLNGSLSSDVIWGFAGTDNLMGFAGNDILWAGTGRDTVSGGGGRDEVYGAEGADILTGNNGRDYIEGGAGADLITGGRAIDVLDGGAGADRFVFNSVSEMKPGRFVETIYNFGRTDIVDLSGIDAIVGGGNNAFRFLAREGADFSDRAGEIRWFWAKDLANDRIVTYIAGDVNGDGRADFEMAMVGRENLNAGDFLL
jgi:Ca2+-binding RTX toxin-like protein